MLRHSMPKLSPKKLKSYMHPYPELQSKAWNDASIARCSEPFLKWDSLHKLYLEYLEEMLVGFRNVIVMDTPFQFNIVFLFKKIQFEPLSLSLFNLQSHSWPRLGWCYNGWIFWWTIWNWWMRICNWCDSVCILHASNMVHKDWPLLLQPRLKAWCGLLPHHLWKPWPTAWCWSGRADGSVLCYLAW